MRIHLVAWGVSLLFAFTAQAAELTAVVQKDEVKVYEQPNFDAPKVATLKRDAAVKIASQQGLWYQLQLADGKSGFVRVNDVRVNYGKAEDAGAGMRVLTTGKAGEGRVTETAGVRGIDESDLKSAGRNQAQLDAMVANRADSARAASYAGEHGWSATAVPMSGEGKRGGKGGKADLQSASGMLSAFSQKASSLLGTASKAAPKDETELAAEEIALGPEIAGRILGARPLWNDATAQQRVNTIGRWVASQSARPELPWTFGVIDTPEINAFAAPGGFILVTRGMFELLASDSEVAAVLGHEIGHCVQRDHYDVIRKQELATVGKDIAMSEVKTGTDTVAGTYARQYVEKNGATIMLTALDRGAEYRADEAAQVYLARAGLNPLAFYSVLQKMAALGSGASSLAQLYKTHPALDDRMDRIDQRGYEDLKAYTKRE
jgi:Zn-dependent protease with chaperone function